MNQFNEAMRIMDQAVQLAIKGCSDIDSMRAVIIAWDTIKPLVKAPEVEDNADSDTDNSDI